MKNKYIGLVCIPVLLVILLIGCSTADKNKEIENIGTNSEGPSEYGETNTYELETGGEPEQSENDRAGEIPGMMMPADPSKMLNSGYTLGEIKRSLLKFEDKLRKDNEDGELTEHDLDILERVANNYGTTLEEVSRVNPDDEVVEEEEKAEQVKQQEQEKEPVKKEQPAEKPIEQPKSVEKSADEPLVFKTDKWFTREEKEEARQRAIERGSLESWEREAKEWEGSPDAVKEKMVSPYTRTGSGGSFDDPNPFK